MCRRKLEASPAGPECAAFIAQRKKQDLMRRLGGRTLIFPPGERGPLVFTRFHQLKALTAKDLTV